MERIQKFEDYCSSLGLPLVPQVAQQSKGERWGWCLNDGSGKNWGSDCEEQRDDDDLSIEYLSDSYRLSRKARIDHGLLLHLRQVSILGKKLYQR